MALGIFPGFVITAHHVRVDTMTLDGNHAVVLNLQGDGVSQIALEGQVHITRRHDQGAIHAACCRKSQRQPRRPVRNHARLGTKSPHATNHRLVQAHAQIAARAGSDMHLLRALEFFHGTAHHAFESWIGHGALQNFGVLIGNHQQTWPLAICALHDGGQLGRMQKAFDGAVHHKVCACQRSHHRRQLRNGIARTGRAYRRWRAQGRRGQRDFKHARPQALQRQARQVHIHPAGLGFGHNRHHFTRLHLAQRKGAGKGCEPFVFNAFYQHACLLCESVYMKFHG